MKYYKDKNGSIFAYARDGSQDMYIPADQKEITEEQAKTILQKRIDAFNDSYVPDSLTRFQLLSALKIFRLDNNESFFNAIDKGITSLSDGSIDNIIIKTAWETATEFGRGSLLVNFIQNHMLLTDTQIDDIFKKGGGITT